MTTRGVFLLLVVALGLASTACSTRDLPSFLRFPREELRLAGCGPECKVCICPLIWPLDPNLCICATEVDPTKQVQGEKSTEIATVMQLEFTRFVPELAACGPECKVCICPAIWPLDPNLCICATEVDPTKQVHIDKSGKTNPAMNAKTGKLEDRAIVLSE